MTLIKSIFIYLLYDEDFNPRYIGKSVQLEGRFKAHAESRSWPAEYRILEKVDSTHDRWQDREKFWIAYFRQWYKLDNIAPGGNGSGPHTPESKRKIGDANRGKKKPPFSDLHILHLALASNGRPNPIPVAAMREANRNRVKSDRECENLSKAQKARFEDPVLGLKLRAGVSKVHKGKIPWNKGKPGKPWKFPIKSCGNAHWGCKVCRPDIFENRKKKGTWNKGLTKEDDLRIAQQGIQISQVARKRKANGQYA